MREIDQWQFSVIPGEKVTFRVAPRETEARFVGVWLDQQKLSPVSQSQPYDEYVWTVSKELGERHVLMLECNFSAAAPATAEYDFWVIGSETGREFLRSVAKKDGNNQDIDIEFFVLMEIYLAAAPPPTKDAEEVEERVPESVDAPMPQDEIRESWAVSLPEQEPIMDLEDEGRKRQSRKRAKPPLRLESEIVRESPKRPGGGGAITAVCPLVIPPQMVERYSGGKPQPRPASPVQAEERNPISKAAQSAGQKAAPSRERFVNVGFTAQAAPGENLPRNMPLTCGQAYYFCVEIGPLDTESLEAQCPTAFPTEQLPTHARLQVVLFSFEHGLEVQAGAAVGELTLQGDGSAVVSRQPAQPMNIDSTSEVLRRKLFFSVRAPATAGQCKLRCSIYCQQLLVQSRLIQARVMRHPVASDGALRSEVDYTLSRTIRPSHLAGMGSHQLSMMLNDNGDGKVGLRFFGEKQFTADATFDGQKLQDLINQARHTLRVAAWGDKDPWTQDKQYRYGGARNFNQLKADLVQMARKGYAFYGKIVDQFTGGKKQSDDLAALMKKPGRVQVALKETARHLIPAALIYDYRLDTGLNDGDYQICATFQKAFNANASLEETDCFKGLCPEQGKSVICPGGFWGFRHYLGMPLSLEEAPDAPTEIDWQGTPHLTMAISTTLELREAHIKVLKALKPGWTWDYADTRDAAITLMKEKKPHLVYFYCHGGLADNEPYIKVGPSDGPRLTDSFLRDEIQWDEPRPLVFINGCHTTALEPEQALEFVSTFVQLAHAAGVIGTEITVFEPLAQTFAENFLRKFVVEGKSVGEAVRSARLALLASGNPLGLAYVPYAIASMQMVEQPAVKADAAGNN